MKERICIILASYFIIAVIGEQFLLIQIPDEDIIRIADYNEPGQVVCCLNSNMFCEER